MTMEDWCDNSKWFNIKLLADVGSGNLTKPINNDKYGKHIKTILTKIGICANNLCHLGCKLGSKFLELLEEQSEEVRKMGQWSPSVYDTHYSTKFLLSAIWKLAGFGSESKIYFNMQMQVMPSDKLLKSTPMGAWCYDMHDKVLEVSQEKGGGHQTAIHMLCFFCELNKIALQDAAVLMIYRPKRDNPAFFQNLEVFQSDAFMVRINLLV